MKALLHIVSMILVVSATVGCLQPEPPPEPFQTGQYGPGLETNLPGEKLEVFGPGGDRLFALRISDSALRIYDADQVRLGTAAIREGQVKITRRSGEEICTVVEESHDTTVVICGDKPVANARQFDDVTWLLEGEDNHGFRLEASGDAIRLTRLNTPVLGTFERSGRSFNLMIDSLAVAGRLVGDIDRPVKELAMLLGASLTVDDEWSAERKIGWLTAAWLATRGAMETAVPPDGDSDDSDAVPVGDTESEQEASIADDEQSLAPVEDEAGDITDDSPARADE